MGIFGIGDGKMELQLNNINVASGETLEGTATLTLNKDVKGKEVIAILYAEREEMRYNQGKETKVKVSIYSKTETLDGDKLYTKANGPYQYKFSFVIPQIDTPAIGSTGGIFGDIMGMKSGGAGVSGMVSGIVRWYVKAELKHESMLTFPVATTQEINMLARPRATGGQI